MTKRIAVVVGSLRKDSLNRKMAEAMIKMAHLPLQLEIVDINDLPLYNQDLEDAGTPPTSWTQFREAIKSYLGVIFVTPEYNRSIPGVLKNALDVGSRPWGKNVWGGKPTAIISVSPSSVGGFGANHHLRQCLVSLDVPTMQQPEAYIGNAADLFNDQGEITKKEVSAIVQKFLDTYAELVKVIER